MRKLKKNLEIEVCKSTIMKDINQQPKPKKKMTKADWIGMVGGLLIASIIFSMGSFGFIPAFLIAMVSFWIVKKIALTFTKENQTETSNVNVNAENHTEQKQEVVQNTETKPAENKGSKKKWIWIGLGIVVLLIVIGALSSPSVPSEDIDLVTTDKSSDFSEQSGNLYRNTKYDFRIKFPEGWDTKPGDGPNILQKAVSGNHTISIGVREIPAEFGDETATIKDVMSLSEFKDTLLEGVQEKFPGATLLDYGEQKLDNEPAYWIKYNAPYTALNITVEGTQVQYQLLKNNIFYFITAGSTSDEFSSVEPEFMKSIATFVIENY